MAKLTKEKCQDVDYQGRDAIWLPRHYASGDQFGATDTRPMEQYSGGRGMEQFTVTARGKVKPAGRKIVVPKPEQGMIYRAQGGRPHPDGEEF